MACINFSIASSSETLPPTGTSIPSLGISSAICFPILLIGFELVFLEIALDGSGGFTGSTSSLALLLELEPLKFGALLCLILVEAPHDINIVKLESIKAQQTFG